MASDAELVGRDDNEWHGKGTVAQGIVPLAQPEKFAHTEFGEPVSVFAETDGTEKFGPRGWACPATDRRNGRKPKFHYFTALGVSLCGRHRDFRGSVDPHDLRRTPDDCGACWDALPRFMGTLRMAAESLAVFERGVCSACGTYARLVAILDGRSTCPRCLYDHDPMRAIEYSTRRGAPTIHVIGGKVTIIDAVKGGAQ